MYLLPKEIMQYKHYSIQLPYVLQDKFCPTSVACMGMKYPKLNCCQRETPLPLEDGSQPSCY